MVVPHEYSTLKHTISPLQIDTANSYLTPEPLILWLYEDFENGDGSMNLQSVPSTVTNTLSNRFFPILPVHLNLKIRTKSYLNYS